MDTTPTAPCPPSRSVFADEFGSVVRSAGAQPRHAESIRQRILRRGVRHLRDLHVPEANLPRDLLPALLERGFVPTVTEVVAESVDPGGSRKLGIRLPDGQVVESVVMPGRTGASVCVSTQVGCAMGCRFCASGLGGLVRNLRQEEIVEQFVHARRRAPVNRAVIMGIGEPLQNFDQLVPALETVCRDLPLDPRRITISSLGHPAWIDRLAEQGTPYSLAISLHSARDELRRELVPTVRAEVAQVVAAAGRYAARHGGRVQYEVVLLAGVNDGEEDVAALAELLRGEPAFVNFIAWNPVEGMPWRRPSEERIRALQKSLGALGVFTTARTSLGRGVDAACGQLRRRIERPDPAASTEAD